MSQQLISRSPDLKRLQDAGYDIDVKSSHLLVRHVPYVNASGEVKLGTLVSKLDLAGDTTSTPSDHVAYFDGDHPCNKDRSEIGKIKHSSSAIDLGEGLLVQRMFSAKPTTGRYEDYYHKMVTYIDIISGPARLIDPQATAQTFPTYEPAEEESVFNYPDTSSSRAGINTATKKLKLGKVGIVGVGGTGSYILDLVAKAPIQEIHLFDGDVFSNHNAFRSPGAPSIDELRSQPKKVAYFHDRYSRMHRRIIPHDCYIDSTNVNQLQEMDFVFLCLDRGGDKQAIVSQMEEWDLPFIDVGMGVQLVDDSLLGILRITCSTVEKRDHVRNNNRIPFSDGDEMNDYSQNIQIADLNALNAALAVVRWKKLFGFYLDLENEHYCAYTIDGNSLINEDNL